MESHPSSLRLFDEVPLGALLDDEVGRVVDLCITKANTLNPVHTVITSEARAALIYLSEGLPHFVQQFGYQRPAEDHGRKPVGESVPIAGV